MKRNELRKFIHTIYNISGKIHQIRNTEVTLKMGIKANSAMLSSLDVIDSNQNLNMSEFSSLMGLTKGAVSQMAQKLEQNGLIEKSRAKDNSKEIYLIVSEKGKLALNEYHKLHDKLYDGIYDILSQYNDQEKQIITEFLSNTNQFLEVYKKTWKE